PVRGGVRPSREVDMRRLVALPCDPLGHGLLAPGAGQQQEPQGHAAPHLAPLPPRLVASAAHPHHHRPPRNAWTSPMRLMSSSTRYSPPTRATARDTSRKAGTKTQFQRDGNRGAAGGFFGRVSNNLPATDTPTDTAPMVRITRSGTRPVTSRYATAPRLTASKAACWASVTRRCRRCSASARSYASARAYPSALLASIIRRKVSGSTPFARASRSYWYSKSSCIWVSASDDDRPNSPSTGVAPQHAQHIYGGTVALAQGVLASEL